MHNIDAMHQECKMGESIKSTCMGFLRCCEGDELERATTPLLRSL
jgi:hypothetical protein